MNVILLEPAFPAYQRDFARALAEIGATVIGIGERSRHELDDQLKSWLAHYEQVRSVVDDDALFSAVRRIQGMLWVDRLEATIEAHVLPAARVRERCTICDFEQERELGQGDARPEGKVIPFPGPRSSAR